jgi:hypothetical protein
MVCSQGQASFNYCTNTYPKGELLLGECLKLPSKCSYTGGSTHVLGY